MALLKVIPTHQLVTITASLCPLQGLLQCWFSGLHVYSYYWYSVYALCRPCGCNRPDLL